MKFFITPIVCIGFVISNFTLAEPGLYRRLYYCAFLVEGHIEYMEYLITFAAKRREDFKGYWKMEDPEKEKIHYQILKDFEDVERERIALFFERGKEAIAKCFNATTFNDEVDLEVVEEISEIRIKNRIDARKFFLQELPAGIYKRIKASGTLNTTARPTPTTTKKITSPTTTQSTTEPIRRLDPW